MAHYQWLYGKITQPSDKLAVIDSELETYAPAETDTDSSRFHKVFKMAQTAKKKKKKKKKRSILKQSCVRGLQPSE